jgi:hypothetical protein
VTGKGSAQAVRRRRALGVEVLQERRELGIGGYRRADGIRIGLFRALKPWGASQKE